MRNYFVFDVESIGLHGEGFAVGGGILTTNGPELQRVFCYSCPTSICEGSNRDRLWVHENIEFMVKTHSTPKHLRDAFWLEWRKAHVNFKAFMAADCLWPVEARFVLDCIRDMPEEHPNAPYPFHDIASIMESAGMDPMKSYDRHPNELPIHNPLADARQSARLLYTALKNL